MLAVERLLPACVIGLSVWGIIINRALVLIYSCSSFCGGNICITAMGLLAPRPTFLLSQTVLGPAMAELLCQCVALK
ncbi:hypothetical protein DPMN_090354 [Dreissena polymorpha]|uniref:Uncharacterized protein n=1 Tax=Dreissena polymorpha TaxID=45954 RepID=A0A9D4KXK3_DREPO|nr:hypothetical protein DPMN_090354 [Dreissena polymorpha]